MCIWPPTPAGFPIVAIASRTKAKAAEVAARWKIATVHDDPAALIEDPQVEILDIAFPPDQQPDLIRHALKQPHIKAILAQKPIAMNFETARTLVAEAKVAGKVLSVNQNMRFDQSIRVLKQLLDRGDLGEPVLATIEMRAIPHWQPFLKEYDRLTLLNMAIHHLDASRQRLKSEAIEDCTDRGTTSSPEDGGHDSTYAGAVIDRCGREDVWAGPARKAAVPTSSSNGASREPKGSRPGRSVGPTIPKESLDLALCGAVDGRCGLAAIADMGRFPDASLAAEQLQHALDTGQTPALNGADNIRTMALIEAGYRSITENRPVCCRSSAA